MIKSLLFIVALSITGVSHSQSSEIVGSWLWRDSSNALNFIIKEDGTIEKRSGTNDDMWGKTPEKGTYVFKKDNLVITWPDKTMGIGKARFIDKSTLEIQFIVKDKPKSRYVFHRIVDEEILPDKQQ